MTFLQALWKHQSRFVHQSLDQPLDTLRELFDGRVEGFSKEVLPLIQLAFKQNVAFYNIKAKDMTLFYQQNQKVKIHPGSGMFRQNPQLVMFNEMLTTQKNYLLMVSCGYKIPLLLNNEFQIDYKKRCFSVNGFEVNTQGVYGAVLSRFLEAVKRFDVGWDIVKELILAEVK